MRVELSADARALQPVVVAADASERVTAAARTLADYLGRITGAKFDVAAGDGSSGIAVGMPGDFPALRVGSRLDPEDAQRREEYLLRSHQDGLWLIGASELAVEHAVWDLLHRLGYRQYFPGAKWEIVPQQPALGIAVGDVQRPDYHARRIWYGYGAWDYAKQPYQQWCAKNRCVQGIELNTGHSYDGIISRNKAAFTEHPEYLALVDGQRQKPKLCISNPELRKLVVEDALAQFAKDPELQSISIDPSDGGGWCECTACARLGSVSDQAVTLANAVAEAVTAGHSDRFVGMYAYSQHSPPPTIVVHPRVVISVATAFIKGGYSVDQLLAGWSKQAQILGIREYYGVNVWDRDLPGQGRGSDLEYLRTTIPHFHAQGARFLSAESSDNWAPNGLGYYLAARMLWDVDEAKNVEALIDEFLDTCFGAARQPMADFYGLLHSNSEPPLCDDLVGRLYRSLNGARSRTDDPAVLARLDDLALYVRYVELWIDYSIAQGPQRQAAFEQLIRHAYRMRTTMMIHAYALYRDLDARDKSVSIPDTAAVRVPENENPWKDSRPWERAEIAGLIREGIANRPLRDFQTVSFSSDLVPARPLRLPDVPTGSVGIYSRSPRSYFTWVEQQPAKLALNVTAGIIYTNQGPVRIRLYRPGQSDDRPLQTVEAAADKQPHALELRAESPGLHRIEIAGGGAASTEWPENTAMTVESSADRPGSFHGRWTLYFYVPRGTRVIGGFSSGEGVLRDPEGNEAIEFTRKPGYFRVPVAAGADGQLWKFDRCSGDKRLMTVPPYLARNAEELLLPREVVENDAR